MDFSIFGVPVIPKPVFTYVMHARIDKAVDWLFAIDDGLGGIVLSCVSGGKIGILRLDLSPPEPVEPVLDWTWLDTDVPSENGDIAVTLSDIWHIFAHGYHWISYAYTDKAKDDSLGLLMIRTDFVVYKKFQVLSHRGTSLVELYGSIAADQFDKTNDHAILETTTGVAVTAKCDGQAGLWCMHFDSSGAFDSNITFVGEHADRLPGSIDAGLSGRLTKSGLVQLFCPSTLWSTYESSIKKLVYKSSLEEADIVSTDEDLIEDPGHNLAMATVVKPAPGWSLVTYRTFVAPQHGSDDGDIYRVLFGNAFKASHSPTEVDCARTGDAGAGSRNRPHTTVWGDYLLTTFSSTDAHCYLLVEEIS